MKYVGVATQFKNLLGIPETSFYSGRLGEWYNSMMQQDTIDTDLLLSILKNGDYIVDLMCGYGRTLRELQRIGFQGIGIDANRDAIGAAQAPTENSESFIHADAFTWSAREPVDAIYMGGVSVSMLSLSEIAKLLERVTTYLKAGGFIYFDYLPFLENDPGWNGDFVLPCDPQDKTSFVISSTQRDSEDKFQTNSFYLQMNGPRSTIREFATHSLHLHDPDEIEDLLNQFGMATENYFDSYQFDSDNLDASLPYWPVRKVIVRFTRF